MKTKVATRGGGFISTVKGRKDVQIMEVTIENRSAVVGQIAHPIHKQLIY